MKIAPEKTQAILDDLEGDETASPINHCPRCGTQLPRKITEETECRECGHKPMAETREPPEVIPDIVDIEAVVGSQETAIVPPGIDFEKLSLADKGMMFAVFNEVKKAVEKRVKEMNGQVRTHLDDEKLAGYENENIRIVLAGGTPRPDTVTYDQEALEKIVGRDTLVEMGVLVPSYSLDTEKLEGLLEGGDEGDFLTPEALEMVRTTKPGGTTAVTLRVTPQGELKKRLRAFTAKALPPKEK